MKRTSDTRESYTSPLLRVNLTEKKIQSEEIPRSLILKFLPTACNLFLHKSPIAVIISMPPKACMITMSIFIALRP